jgi:hypothetical protein
MEEELPRLEVLGWRLVAPLGLLFAGCRDLPAVTTDLGLDRNSSAVVEVLLGRIRIRDRESAPHHRAVIVATATATATGAAADATSSPAGSRAASSPTGPSSF